MTPTDSYIQVLKPEDEKQHVQQPSPLSMPPPHTTVLECIAFKPHKQKQPGLRANVFVSKECTKDLAEHIVEENWGKDNGMLYKYLDYIFRCQIFDAQVKKITLANKAEIVVFHTGLQRRNDHNFLYFVLKQNDPEKRNAEQRWRVPAGNINASCISQTELMNKPYFLKHVHLPQRTKFYNSLSELLFDESYQIEVNWPERLRTNKERIYQELKHKYDKNMNNNLIEKNKLVSELTDAFTVALKKAANRAKANPRLAVAQGFVETKHYKKRVELLLPLKVEYPKESRKYHTFALALRKVENMKKYTGMSLLTMSMAYANARLVGYVDSSWLTNDGSYKKDKKDKDEKGDKERSSTHAPSPQNSSSNASLKKEREAMNVPGTMIFGASNGRMTFAPAQRVNRSRGGNVGNALYSHNIAQSLPAIPSNQPIPHMVGVQEVNLTDIPAYNNAYYYQQQQQQYQHKQQVIQPPYIADSRSEQSDNNPPLSNFDTEQAHNNNNNAFKSGLGAIPSAQSLKYSQSAQPVMAHNPPQLHNKLPEPEEEEESMFVDHLASLDTPRGLMLDGTSEQEIQSLKVKNLKYFPSEPPSKPTIPHVRKKRLQHTPTPSPKNIQVPIQQYYASHNVATVPRQVQKYAQPTTQQFGFVPYQKTHYSTNIDDTHSNHSDNNGPKFLLQASQLPGDCGVNTLRQIFSGTVKLQSVHLVDDDKTAVLRFDSKNALQDAIAFAKQFAWMECAIISDSPYLKNFDQQNVWQYQESNKWKAHHEEMGTMIDKIPPRTDLIIEHGLRKYFIEKYNRQQGRQTNLRTRNQRMIRRIRIHVWAPRTNPIRQKAIPRIIPTHQQMQPLSQPPEYVDNYFFGKTQQSMPYHQGVQQQQQQVILNSAAQPPAIIAASHPIHPSHNTNNNFVSNRVSTNKAPGINPTLNADAPEYDPAIPAINPVVGSPIGINITNINNINNINKKRPTMITQSQPPFANNNAYNYLTPTQLINPTHIAAPNDIHIINQDFSHLGWEKIDVDEPEYSVLQDECQTGQFSGIWYFSKCQHNISSGRGGKKYTLYYVPDMDDAQNLFQHGFNASLLDGFRVFCKTVKKALSFNEDEDEENNIKIFECSVFLSPNEQTNISKLQYVNIADPKRIELIACCAVNINVLKKALNM